MMHEAPWLADLLDDIADERCSDAVDRLAQLGERGLDANVRLVWHDCTPEEGVSYATALWQLGRVEEAREVVGSVVRAVLAAVAIPTLSSRAGRWRPDVVAAA